MTHRQLANEPNELARLVKAWRLRLDPDKIPGISTAHTPTPRRRHASKELIATLAGCSIGWYSTLERGEAQNYSDDFLNRVAEALCLSQAEKNVLFLRATGHALTMTAHEPQIRRTPALQRILDAQPWPAYVSDEAWNLVGYNTHMSTWFPWVEGPENNVMRWVFTAPEARTLLHHWETEWAPQMFAEMQFAQAQQPENTRLAAIIDEILDNNPHARRFVERPLTYPHPDGDQRDLKLPSHSEIQRVELVAFEPMRAPGSRFMMLVPLGSV
jgi:transcriptional regulator with XRE-family HTH domain